MVGISGGGGGDGGGYNYVQDAEPADPDEGEEWYDSWNNAAFVYDGTIWIEQTVADHSQLTGVNQDDHHSRPTGTTTAGINGGYTQNQGDGLRSVADGIQLSSGDGGCFNPQSTDFTVEFADGSTERYNNIDGTETRNFGDRAVVGVSIDKGSGCVNASYNLHLVTLTDHNHGI